MAERLKLTGHVNVCLNLDVVEASVEEITSVAFVRAAAVGVSAAAVDGVLGVEGGVAGLPKIRVVSSVVDGVGVGVKRRLPKWRMSSSLDGRRHRIFLTPFWH